MAPSAHLAGGRRTARWTREEIINKVVEWHALHGDAPVSADWNPSLARWRAQEWRIARYRDGRWPSTNAVKRAFGGSFDAAVIAAGFAPARPGPKGAGGAVPARAGAGALAAGGAGDLGAGPAEAVLLRARLADAERRAERADRTVAEARRRTRRANERAVRAQRARDRAVADAGARVRAAIDQAEAASREAAALRSAHPGAGLAAGPAGPAHLALALRALAAARASGDRHGLRRALGDVAAAALRWRDRL